MQSAEHRLRAGPAFFRAHGLGNDYLVFEGADSGRSNGPEEGGWLVEPRAVELVCHRRRGLGSDGLVVLLDPEPPPDSPFPLRMFNPDGSEFERSGNGLRILAAHLHRRGLVREDPFQVRSGGEDLGMQVHGPPRAGRFDVSVRMGRARVGGDAVGLVPDRAGVDGAEATVVAVLEHPRRGDLRVTPVSVGNPHAVVFLEETSGETLADVGPFLSRHPAFRNGTNVQIARIEGPSTLRIGIWERGVGRTAASGTSACAAAVAAVHRGDLKPGLVEVEMEGGRLHVTVTEELDVTLRGPVQEVASGRLTPGFVESLAVRS
jgi:diaminopimelate epimerase